MKYPTFGDQTTAALNKFHIFCQKVTKLLNGEMEKGSKGTTINDLGVGPEEIEKKIFMKVHIRKK